MCTCTIMCAWENKKKCPAKGSDDGGRAVLRRRTGLREGMMYKSRLQNEGLCTEDDKYARTRGTAVILLSTHTLSCTRI